MTSVPRTTYLVQSYPLWPLCSYQTESCLSKYTLLTDSQLEPTFNILITTSRVPKSHFTINPIKVALLGATENPIIPHHVILQAFHWMNTAVIYSLHDVQNSLHKLSFSLLPQCGISWIYNLYSDYTHNIHYN